MTDHAIELEYWIEKIRDAKPWEKPGLYYTAANAIAKLRRSSESHPDVAAIIMQLSSLKGHLAKLCELEDAGGHSDEELFVFCFEDISLLKIYLSEVK